MDKSMPVFVKIEDCTEIVQSLGLLKDKLRRAHSLLDRLHELKAQEDAALSNWRRDLEQVDERVRVIDKKLFEA